MRYYLSLVLLVILMIVYTVGCLQYIMPQESMPYIIRLVTLIGPLFIAAGMIRLRIKRIRAYRASQKKN